MSKLLDRFRYFKTKGDSFADGHGQVYWIPTGTGKTVTVNAGSMTKLSVLPTA
ncbi:MAG: hypothetical protein ACLTW6_06750 [Enterobacter sp.]